MEYFEISVFPEKNKTNEYITNRIKEVLKNNIDFSQNIIVELFQYDDKEFDDICVSIPNYRFDKDNLEANGLFLTKIVELLFKSFPNIRFATGVYEITFDYIEELSKMKDFDKGFFEKFPLVFWNQSNFIDNKIGNIIYSDGSIVCTYNNKVQTIV